MNERHPIHEADHPLWSFLRYLVGVAAIGIIMWALLYKNADSFDETEIKTILEIMLLSGGALFGKWGYKTWRSMSDEGTTR